MPYAEGRRYLDADSHIMERPNFLLDHADAATREILGPLLVGDHGKSVDYLEDAAQLEAHIHAAVARGEILGIKQYFLAQGQVRDDVGGDGT